MRSRPSGASSSEALRSVRLGPVEKHAGAQRKPLHLLLYCLDDAWVAMAEKEHAVAPTVEQLSARLGHHKRAERAYFDVVA